MSIYITADTFFIANGVGNLGLTGLNIVLPFYSLLNGLGLLLGVGGSNRYSSALGAGDKVRANRIFTEVTVLTVIVGALFTLAGVCAPREICVLLGADAEVIEYASKYLRTIACFSIPFSFNHVLMCFIRNDFAPKLSMLAMLSSSVANIVLDYILIYPLQLGMFGASFATGFSSVISIAVLSFHFLRKRNSFKLIKTKFYFNDIKYVFTTGTPTLITELSTGIVILVFNLVIYELAGNIGISTYSVIANLALVAVFTCNGICQGIQPLVSYNYGIRNTVNIKKTLLYGMATALGVGIIFYIAFYFGRNFFVAIFNSENSLEMTTLAEQGIILYCISFIFTGVNLVCGTYFASTNKPIFSMVITLLRGIVLPVGLVFVMKIVAGLNGVWLTMTVAECITTLLALAMLLFRSIKDKKAQLKLDKEKETLDDLITNEEV